MAGDPNPFLYTNFSGFSPNYGDVTPSKERSRLKISFTDSFGYNSVVETDIFGDDFNSVMDSLRQCLNGLGFSEKLVNDYFDMSEE